MFATKRQSLHAACAALRCRRLILPKYGHLRLLDDCAGRVYQPIFVASHVGFLQNFDVLFLRDFDVQIRQGFCVRLWNDFYT